MDAAGTINTDTLETVRRHALLADVSIGVPAASEAAAAQDALRAAQDALRAAQDALRAARGAYMAVRTRHYRLTLPWAFAEGPRQEGPRLLALVLVERYMVEMSALAKAAVAARDRCEIDDKQRSAFRLQFDIVPLPDAAALEAARAAALYNDGSPEARAVAMSELMCRRLTQTLTARQQRAAAAAAVEVWQRVGQPLRQLVRRLEAPVASGASARFKDATVSALAETVELLPGWNVAGDPRLAEVTTDLQHLLEGVDAKDLRRTPALRAHVAAQARMVSDKMSSWGV